MFCCPSSSTQYNQHKSSQSTSCIIIPHQIKYTFYSSNIISKMWYKVARMQYYTATKALNSWYSFIFYKNILPYILLHLEQNSYIQTSNLISKLIQHKKKYVTIVPTHYIYPNPTRRQVLSPFTNTQISTHHVCPSICLHVSTRLQLDGFSQTFILKTFIKLYQGNSKFFLDCIIKINRQQFINKVRKFPNATLQSKYKAQYMQQKSRS